MKMRMSALAVLVGLAAGQGSFAATDISFTLLSGQGGSEAVRFYSYGDRAAHVPLLPDFQAAMSGDAAEVMPTDVDGWSPLTSPYDSALPVFNMTADKEDPTQGSSSLFGVSFDVPAVNISAASIEFMFSVDNNLGGVVRGSPAQGLYLNGTALSGDTRYYFDESEFPTKRFFENERIFRDDIGGYLIPGEQNWLFMNVRDFQPQAGILFGASITVSHNPEPSTVIVWSVLGLCGAGVVTWRRRRRRS